MSGIIVRIVNAEVMMVSAVKVLLVYMLCMYACMTHITSRYPADIINHRYITNTMKHIMKHWIASDGKDLTEAFGAIQQEAKRIFLNCISGMKSTF